MSRSSMVMALVLSGANRKLVTDLDNEMVKDIESRKEVSYTYLFTLV